tara:strand:- start:428 stop:568 length:141 start_codon:yes stop_codon:yes gene_type:complete
MELGKLKEEGEIEVRKAIYLYLSTVQEVLGRGEKLKKGHLVIEQII